MNRIRKPAALAALAFAWAMPARSQDFDELHRKMEQLQIDLQARIPEIEARVRAHLPDSAFFAQRAGMMRDDIRRGGQDDRLYDSASRELDSGNWDAALQKFTKIAAMKSSRAEGALYWKAYAENRLGRRDDALATIAALRKDYPASRWLADAQALEVEVRQRGGNPANPEAQANEDLKLMALNGLLQSDPNQAVPAVEKLLHNANSPRLKEKALFVLTQSSSPRARQILLDTAKGASNPDLQLKAIRYIATMGSTEARQQLADIYKSSSDLAIKRTVLRSYMASGSKDTLLEIAKSEQNQDLRSEAIRELGALGAQPELWQLYQSESSPENRKRIMKATFESGNFERLTEIARTEKDPSLRQEAVKYLGMTGNNAQVTDALASMYQPGTPVEMRKEIVQSLFIQQNAKALVEIARKENDPAMKQYIVQRLSSMRSKESTDYLMELLGK